MSKQIVDLKTEQQVKDVISDSAKLTVIDCYAAWCGPCKVLGKSLDTFASTYAKDDVNFCKLDVDNPEFEQFCVINSISALPTVLFLRGDVVLNRIVGNDFEKFKTFVNQYTNVSHSTTNPTTDK
jgi:thioredoxin 1